MSSEAIFCYDTATVRFAIYPDGFDGARVIAQISEHALRDHFGARGDGSSLVAAYARHAPTIDAVAIDRYRSAPQRPVLLGTADFDLSSVVLAGVAMKAATAVRESRVAV